MNVMRIQGESERSRGVYYEYDRDSQPLGEGGMGRIFAGYMMYEYGGMAPVPVAIKEIHDHISREAQLIERAQREASIQITHDNLLQMYGFVSNVEYDPMHDANIVRHYMVMERLIGVDLEQLLKGVVTEKTGIPIPYAQELLTTFQYDRTEAIIRIIRSVLEGIMALHGRGYIHRDIDPSNIMITLDHKIKLIDFGVCKNINVNVQEKMLTQAGSFIGKVNYAAPELALGDVNHQNYTTDLYAVGVLMYQLAVGRLPFNGTNQEVLAAQVGTKMPVGDIADKALRRVVEKATQKKQEKRYMSAAEMIVDLDKILRARKTFSAGFTESGVSPIGGTQITRSNGGMQSAYGIPVNNNSGEGKWWAIFAAAGLVLGLIAKLIVILC